MLTKEENGGSLENFMNREMKNKLGWEQLKITELTGKIIISTMIQ